MWNVSLDLIICPVLLNSTNEGKYGVSDGMGEDILKQLL